MKLGWPAKRDTFAKARRFSHRNWDAINAVSPGPETWSHRAESFAPFRSAKKRPLEAPLGSAKGPARGDELRREDQALKKLVPALTKKRREDSETRNQRMDKLKCKIANDVSKYVENLDLRLTGLANELTTFVGRSFPDTVKGITDTVAQRVDREQQGALLGKRNEWHPRNMRFALGDRP